MAALTDTTTDADVARIPELEEWMTARGIDWRFVPDVALDSIDTVAGLANQARFLALDDAVVERYAADYERGDRFPALVIRVTGTRHVPIGGNHRTASARRAQLTTHPAYLVTCSDTEAHLIAVEDNRRHGLPLTDEERIHHALALIDQETHTIPEAADACGVALPKLRHVIASHRTRKRCGRLQLAGWETFSTTTLSKLDSLADDEVFAATVDALASGSVLAKEVTDLVARLRERPTTKDALDLLVELTGGAEGRVRPPSGHPPSAERYPRARLLIDLDRILNYDAGVVAADCQTPEQARQVANQLKAVARRIKAILDEVEGR